MGQLNLKQNNKNKLFLFIVAILMGLCFMLSSCSTPGNSTGTGGLLGLGKVFDWLPSWFNDAEFSNKPVVTDNRKEEGNQSVVVNVTKEKETGHNYLLILLLIGYSIPIYVIIKKNNTISILTGLIEKYDVKGIKEDSSIIAEANRSYRNDIKPYVNKLNKKIL